MSIWWIISHLGTYAHVVLCGPLHAAGAVAQGAYNYYDRCGYYF